VALWHVMSMSTPWCASALHFITSLVSLAKCITTCSVTHAPLKDFLQSFFFSFLNSKNIFSLKKCWDIPRVPVCLRLNQRKMNNIARTFYIGVGSLWGLLPMKFLMLKKFRSAIFLPWNLNPNNRQQKLDLNSKI
jgi:hypothetical protein